MIRLLLWLTAIAGTACQPTPMETHHPAEFNAAVTAVAAINAAATTTESLATQASEHGQFGIPIPPDDPSAEIALNHQLGTPDIDHPYDTTSFPIVTHRNRKSADGYPIYLVVCSPRTRVCQTSLGEDLGPMEAVVAQMTRVRNIDVVRLDWDCNTFCRDQDGRMVGAVSEEMREWMRYQRQHSSIE